MIHKPNLKKRIIGTSLDYGITFLLTSIYIMLVGQENDDGGKTVSGLRAFPLLAFWFTYFVLIETFYGATLGHLALNLKVLTINRKGIDIIQALKRHLLDPIDIFLYGIPAIIAIKNSERCQRLGDMWAKTIVIDTGDKEQMGTITTA